MEIGSHGCPYHLLLRFLVVFLLFEVPPPVSGFGQGTQIQANFGMYCNRRASQRFPIHADVTRCGGFCAPRRDDRNLFTLRVNATTYFSDSVQVSITSDPRAGFRSDIRGFAVIAMTDDETIVGSFLEQPDALIASCDPLMEGDTAFHARARLNRRSVTLNWDPDSRNYGRVRFRVWIVVQHHDIYVLDSEYIDNEISGTGRVDLQNNFYTFILQVFNISRSAATILSNGDGADDNNNDSKTNRISNSEGGIENTTPAPPTRIDTLSRLHSGGQETEEDTDLVGASSVAVDGSDLTDRKADRQGVGTGMFTQNAVNRIINRFTTSDPRAGTTFATVRNRGDMNSDRGDDVTATSTTVSTRNMADDSSGDSNIVSSSNSRSDINNKNSNSSVSSGDNRGINSSGGNSKSSNISPSNNSSVVSVMVSLASGQSMKLSIPSLVSFEKAFERRLRTTGFDINAEDPFHQLKQDVPTFRDLFPHPLPTSTSALSATLSSSAGNPFFQAFGSTQNSQSPGRLSQTTRIRQTFDNLLSNLGRRNGFRGTGQNTNTNLPGGSVGQMNRPPNHRNGLGFPTNTDPFQRPNTNTGFNRLNANGQFSRNREQISNTLTFQNNAVPFQNPRTITAFPGRNLNLLSPNSQRNPFSAIPGASSPVFSRTIGNTNSIGNTVQTGFPDPSSLFGRTPQLSTVGQFPQNLNQNGVFNSASFENDGFNQQNSRFNAFRPQNSDVNFLRQQNSINALRNQQNTGNSFFGMPNVGGNVFAQQNWGNNPFGQQSRFGNSPQSRMFQGSAFGQFTNRFGVSSTRAPNNQFGRVNVNPFSSQGSLQNTFINRFNGLNPPGSMSVNTNLFNSEGNQAIGGFQPRSGSSNPFVGNVPNLFSLNSNINGFPGGNIANRFNPLSSRLTQNGFSSGGSQFNSLWTGQRGTDSVQRPSGSLASRMFSNPFIG